MTLFTGFFVPVPGLGFILCHTQSLLVHVTQPELGFGVALLGEPLLEVEYALPGSAGETGGTCQHQNHEQQ